MENSKTLLLVFVKNPEPGKVKTRLAKTVGQEKALEVYQWLLDYTHQVTKQVPFHRAVFYSDHVDEDDLFENNLYNKFIQVGDDLGERMLNAFQHAFSRGYEKVLIIGSDCYQLTPHTIEEAENALDEHDVVIGPAKDGGYYLLGMKSLHPEFFTNKKWGTENVLLDTILDVQNKGLSHRLLDTLNDLDDENDLADLRTGATEKPE